MNICLNAKYVVQILSAIVGQRVEKSFMDEMGLDLSLKYRYNLYLYWRGQEVLILYILKSLGNSSMWHFEVLI